MLRGREFRGWVVMGTQRFLLVFQVCKGLLFVSKNNKIFQCKKVGGGNISSAL